MKNENLLVKLFGWRATLIHGDTTTLDRWLWLRRRLPKPGGGAMSLIDIGCGTGAFTIGAAKLGYRALGLSWDERNQSVAYQRAKLSGVETATFEVQDVRSLDTRIDLAGSFDVAILCEVIEHVLKDEKLVRDTANCLKPGGLLLLTTPNIDYRPITKSDLGPFLEVETGWHVRKGYSADGLRKLVAAAGLHLEEVSFCTGFVSQKVTGAFRVLSGIHPWIAWIAVLPLRLLPVAFDKLLRLVLKWPEFSICLTARRVEPR
jgi:2-polyprenyl-3-methyl-5-hydroxy-6-metoxy-1,4-benzoquinol methylase